MISRAAAKGRQVEGLPEGTAQTFGKAGFRGEAGSAGPPVTHSRRRCATLAALWRRIDDAVDWGSSCTIAPLVQPTRRLSVIKSVSGNETPTEAGGRKATIRIGTIA